MVFNYNAVGLYSARAVNISQLGMISSMVMLSWDLSI